MLGTGPIGLAASFVTTFAVLAAVLAAVSSGLRLLPVLGLGVLKRHVGDRDLLRDGLVVLAVFVLRHDVVLAIDVRDVRRVRLAPIPVSGALPGFAKSPVLYDRCFL